MRSNVAYVLFAHQADDLVETFLLHLLRGAGSRGLTFQFATPLTEDVTILRPLWKTSRRDIETYAAKHKLEFRVDPSNASRDYTRNRIRHELLPLLERDYNPAVRDVILRTAEVVSGAQGFLAAASELELNVRRRKVAGRALDLRGCEGLPSVVAREMIRSWCAHVSSGHVRLTHNAVTRICDKLRHGGAFSFRISKDERITRIGEELLLADMSHEIPSPTSAHTPLGRLENPIQLTRDQTCYTAKLNSNGQMHEVLVFGLEESLRLVLRNRLPGDRVSQHTRLKKLLIDKRVPQQHRDTLLLVADEGNEVYGVVGRQDVTAYIGRLRKTDIRISFSPIPDGPRSVPATLVRSK